ncbi:hypothetical protein L210DRAFT_361059 [Boletus edulis BED1]|uniref:Uncharacterized protein n=1 Tax=Boletus edulis BED1 TaxID=1328754 RepID=A0AAD4B975_BOLED|nr:hypothetical protein L210DRAFT_361059 [Boletus edulis BED1]
MMAWIVLCFQVALLYVVVFHALSLSRFYFVGVYCYKVCNVIAVMIPRSSFDRGALMYVRICSENPNAS